MHKLALIFFLLSAMACNKNTLELPPPKDNIITKVVTCSLNYTNMALIKFIQDRYDKDGKVAINISNLTGKAITDLKIYIEICDSIPSYYNCNNQTVFFVPELGAKNDTTYILPFRNIKLDTTYVNAGIISTSTIKGILSGVYNGDNIKFVTITNIDTIPGFVKGVVFGDGISLFRIGGLGNNNSAYNLTGNFVDSTAFNNGKFLDRNLNTRLIDHYASDIFLNFSNTVNNFNSNPVLFKFQLNTPQIISGFPVPINKILFKLTKLP